MTCFIRQLTEEEKRSNFLLCPLKSFTSQEKKLFLLAVLCDPFSMKQSIPTHDKDNLPNHHETISDNEYEKYETSAACSCERRLCQTKTETPTQSHGEEHKCEDNASVSVLPIDSNTNTKKCNTSQWTTDSTDSFLFLPLPDIPSLLFQQTYRKWKAVMDNHLRLGQIRRRRTIYIQPMDDFPEFIHKTIGNDTDTICGATTVGFFELLREYMKVFFSGLNVVIRPTIKTTGNVWSVQSRYHHVTGKKQLLVGDIHKGLKKVLPKDGCCIVGVTWTDLYPSAELNFVLGEASMEHRCAAFCFGRYEPKCYVDGKEPVQMEEIDGFIVWKMLKVISHEACHVFNMAHCVHFECLMNESSSLVQMLAQPNFLCPVCLCKLKKVTKCNVLHRYQRLLRFYEDVHRQFPSTFMANAIAWLKKVLTFLD